MSGTTALATTTPLLIKTTTPIIATTAPATTTPPTTVPKTTVPPTTTPATTVPATTTPPTTVPKTTVPPTTTTPPTTTGTTTPPTTTGTTTPPTTTGTTTPPTTTGTTTPPTTTGTTTPPTTTGTTTPPTTTGAVTPTAPPPTIVIITQGGSGTGGSATITNNPTFINQIQEVQPVFSSDQQASAGPPVSIGTASFTPQAAPTDNFQVIDEALNLAYHTPGEPYTGSVAGIQNQYININTTNLNIDAITPNAFIKTGSGDDYLQAFAGRNVLDGGTGNNIFTSGTGQDTIIAAADPITTVADLIKHFHVNDDAILRGITPNFAFTTTDTTGKGGKTLTIDAKSPTGVDASLSIAGYTVADLNAGKLSMTFSTDPSTNTPFMLIHANS